MKKGERFRFGEIDKDEYEALCRNRSIPLTQRWFYGEWQEAVGKKVWRYEMRGDVGVIGFFQVIKYPMAYGRSYLYIPHGPVLTGEISSGLSVEFNFFCRELLRKASAVFLRFDPTWTSGHQVAARFNLAQGSTLRRVPKFMYDGNFQPKFEWVLDLNQSEDEILAGMKKVNRYTVRQAKKSGVKVEIMERNFLQYLDKFYELIEATAERDTFSHNSKDYYAKIFEECERNKNAFMEVARYGDEIMLVNFFVNYGDTTFFLFSGSENEHRKVGYTYLAQWAAIRYAKGKGFKKYNFGAVITDDNRYPLYRTWQGFSDFKKRFGGSLVEYADLHDVINNRYWYSLYVIRRILALIKMLF